MDLRSNLGGGFLIYLLYIKLAELASETSLNQTAVPYSKAKMRGITPKPEMQKAKLQLPSNPCDIHLQTRWMAMKQLNVNFN